MAASGGSFSTLGLSLPLKAAITHAGSHSPTPVQCRSFLVSLSGRNLACMARTRSGKTLTFVLLVLENLL